VLEILKFDISDLNPGDPGTVVEDAPVADHHDARSLAHFLQGHDFGRQLRADAGWVADGKRDYGFLQVNLPKRGALFRKR
jgi:hypothetical protein